MFRSHIPITARHRTLDDSGGVVYVAKRCFVLVWAGQLELMVARTVSGARN